MKDKENRSKHLAYLLRHDKDYNFFKPDGWREIEDLVKRAYTEQGLHSIAIEGDMNYEVNIDPEQIAMWISFVADIVFLIKAFKKSRDNNINDNQRQLQMEENITEEVIEFESFLKNKGNRYIETKKYKKKITRIYKKYGSKFK